MASTSGEGRTGTPSPLEVVKSRYSMTIAEYHGCVRLEKVYYIRSLMNAHADHCAHMAEFYGQIVEEGPDSRRQK